jgi:hypothetical protein
MPYKIVTKPVDQLEALRPGKKKVRRYKGKNAYFEAMQYFEAMKSPNLKIRVYDETGQIVDSHN